MTHLSTAANGQTAHNPSVGQAVDYHLDLTRLGR